MIEAESTLMGDDQLRCHDKWIKKHQHQRDFRGSRPRLDRVQKL